MLPHASREGSRPAPATPLFLRRYFLRTKIGSRQEAVLLWAGTLEPIVCPISCLAAPHLSAGFHVPVEGLCREPRLP